MLNGLLGIFRPPFLALSLTFAAAGAAVGEYDGGFSWTHSLLLAVAAVSAHAAMNALHARLALRASPPGAPATAPLMWEAGTPAVGGLTPAASLRTALIAMGVAGAVFVYFLADSASHGMGPRMLPLAVVWLVVVLLYADVFSRIGLGELAAATGVGALPVLGGAFVQDGFLGPAGVAGGITAFFLALSLALLDGAADVEADRARGLRTIAVLAGRKTAARLFVVSAFAVPLFILAAMTLGALPWTTLLALLPIVAVVSPLGWALRRPGEAPPPDALSRVMFWGVSTAVLMVAATFVAIYFRM